MLEESTKNWIILFCESVERLNKLHHNDIKIYNDMLQKEGQVTLMLAWQATRGVKKIYEENSVDYPLSEKENLRSFRNIITHFDEWALGQSRYQELNSTYQMFASRAPDVPELSITDKNGETKKITPEDVSEQDFIFVVYWRDRDGVEQSAYFSTKNLKMNLLISYNQISLNNKIPTRITIEPYVKQIETYERVDGIGNEVGYRSIGFGVLLDYVTLK